MTTSEIPSCRGCGSNDVEWIGKKRGEFIHGDFDYYRCRHCQLEFVVPYAGTGIYNADYYEGRGPDPYVNYEAEYTGADRRDRDLEFNDLARIADKFFARRSSDAPLRWLDFGCGAGGLLKFLRERGSIGGRPLELTGHDVGAFADRLRDHDGFRILGFEQLIAEPDNRYDIISLVEVIEHIEYPKPVIELAARLLSPGGLLLLTTGNMHSPIARSQGLNYHYHRPEIHVSLFSPPALTRMYREAGLQPLHVRYDGSVRFKVVKTLRTRAKKRLGRAILRLPFVVRWIDRIYGVSAMPCATKPNLKASL